MVEHQLQATINKKKEREVFLYNKADWDGPRKQLKTLAADYLRANPAGNRRSLNNNWLWIKGTLTGAMRRFIPTKTIGTRFNLPYLTPIIKRKMRKRQRVFKRARKYNRQADWDVTKTLRKEINLFVLQP